MLVGILVFQISFDRSQTVPFEIRFDKVLFGVHERNSELLQVLGPKYHTHQRYSF